MSEKKYSKVNQPLDLKKLKFKSGLEIHQQLDTKKLFCNCDSVLRKDEPDFVIKRKLHAVAGEGGDIDIAAQHEMTKDKEFIYEGYNTTCLVEQDEEPPHEINKEALKIALQISLLLNCKIIPITQIMRKTVINGSNTSGFQRTVMIARDGYIITEQGKVGIDFVYLEEDAARIVKKEGNKTFYRLDRLGIPLVEVVTAPDVKTPEQAKEVALQLGDILRSCKVKRGLGTIRQDVNISILGENRVEIKGMQNMDLFVKTIENEIRRHIKLSDKGDPVEMEVRNALPDSTTKFMRPLPGSARMYPETDLPLLKIPQELINDVKNNLPKLRTDAETELRKKGLNQEMIKLLFKQNKLDEFKELFEIIGNPQLVAKVLLIFPKEIAKREKISAEEIKDILTRDTLAEVLVALKRKKISEGDIKHILQKVVKGEDINKAIKVEKGDHHIIEEKIMKIINGKPGLNPNAYMGLIMKEFKGKILGKEAMEAIKKFTE